MINEHDLADMAPANDIQHGGTHYKQFKDFQPWDVVTAWGLGYLDGTALKYIARWKYKNGVEDIKKAIHFLQKLLEEEEKKQEELSTKRMEAALEAWQRSIKQLELFNDTE